MNAGIRFRISGADFLARIRVNILGNFEGVDIIVDSQYLNLSSVAFLSRTSRSIHDVVERSLFMERMRYARDGYMLVPTLMLPHAQLSFPSIDTWNAAIGLCEEQIRNRGLRDMPPFQNVRSYNIWLSNNRFLIPVMSFLLDGHVVIPSELQDRAIRVLMQANPQLVRSALERYLVDMVPTQFENIAEGSLFKRAALMRLVMNLLRTTDFSQDNELWANFFSVVTSDPILLELGLDQDILFILSQMKPSEIQQLLEKSNPQVNDLRLISDYWNCALSYMAASLVLREDHTGYSLEDSRQFLRFLVTHFESTNLVLVDCLMKIVVRYLTVRPLSHLQASRGHILIQDIIRVGTESSTRLLLEVLVARAVDTSLLYGGDLDYSRRLLEVVLREHGQQESVSLSVSENILNAIILDDRENNQRIHAENLILHLDSRNEFPAFIDTLAHILVDMTIAKKSTNETEFNRAMDCLQSLLGRGSPLLRSKILDWLIRQGINSRTRPSRQAIALNMINAIIEENIPGVNEVLLLSAVKHSFTEGYPIGQQKSRELFMHILGRIKFLHKETLPSILPALGRAMSELPFSHDVYVFREQVFAMFSPEMKEILLQAYNERRGSLLRSKL